MKRLRLPMLLLVGIVGALSARQLWRDHMDRRLLETWPELAARDPDLSRYATSRAAPALAEHCAGCHGADLRGNRAKGAPDLLDGEWLFGDGNVVDIEQSIDHGIRSGDHRGRDLADMPGFLRQNPYGRYHIDPLSRADIRDLAAFIARLGGSGSHDPAAAARGEVLYGKALCYDCHTVSARGDPSIGAPSLRRHAWLFGADSDTLIDVISYGRAGVCPAWAGRLPAATIRAIAIALHVRSGQSG